MAATHVHMQTLTDVCLTEICKSEGSESKGVYKVWKKVKEMQITSISN